VSVRVHEERVRDGIDDSEGTSHDRLVLQLRYARGLVGIADLGYSESEQRRMRMLLGETGGLVVVAGPTGAGKTATLYAAARELSWWGRLVSTVEQTIEYPLSGITQFSLGTGCRLSLAEAIRAAGGMTSDIVASAVIADATLDATTFESCASAASRGQLVVATLVAPDLSTSFAHLRALHPDGEPVAASLRGVVVQRLLRRLCDACAAPQHEADLPELERSLLAQMPDGRARRPVGCHTCLGTGYRGRIAIVEIVPITPPLSHAIARRAVATELMYVMREQRFPTLWDSGLAHVRAGTTSLAELLDAVSPPQEGVAHEDLDAMLSEVLKPARSSRKRRD
jgi:type II secretory ATPase GspE/PulE/Tfp pilus assembly ATPase PilB-like protein